MAGRIQVNGSRGAYAYEALTISSSALGLTATNYFQQSATQPTRVAQYALITVETNPIRYRTDGTNPTSSEGHLLNVNDVLVLDNHDDIRRFRAIRQSASDGTIRVSYF